MTEKSSAFATRLGLAHPIFQAPMAGFQGAAMAAAVSNAGGLGAVPAAPLSAEALEKAMRELKAATDRPFNVNFFCHVPPEPDAAREALWRVELARYFDEFGIAIDDIPPASGRAPFSHAMADVLDAVRPAVVSFHFGLPAPDLLARVKGWGSRVASSATTVEEARWLQAHGADVVIAQGVEAGGHRGMFLDDDLDGQLGTFALLPQVVAAVDLPVVAAGGIADARGVAAALALGASAVQVGTSYLLCDEATTSAVHRAALQGPGSARTALTNLFSGRPARGIVNRAMKEIGPIGAAVPAFPLASGAMAPLRSHAEKQGSGDFSPLWSGQNATGCRAVSAADMTRSLAAGCLPQAT